jgi:hypothetical protein
MWRNRRGCTAFWAAFILPCTLLASGAASRIALAEFALAAPEKDSTLIENSTGALSNGSGPAIFAGRISSGSNSIRRALVDFNLSSQIPPGSIVTKAILSLYLSSTNAGPVPIRLHRVLADWGEGASASSGGGGAPSTPGDSTWIHRFYADSFWNQAGGDFDPTPSAVALVDQIGRYSWGSTAEMVSDVQGWLDHPETGFGWILLGDESRATTVKRFDSREAPELESRPLLYVEFTPPCSPDPKGQGYWKQQCSDLQGDADVTGRESPESKNAEPRFAEWVVPCANRILADLGLPEVSACDAFKSDPTHDCQQRALRKLSVLVLNVCAARLQTSCPVDDDEGDCVSTHVADLLQELSLLILQGDCQRASGCAGIPD